MFRRTIAMLAVVGALGVSPFAGAADYVFLVAGFGGEPQYAEEFSTALDAIRTSLIERHHYDPDHFIVPGESPTNQGSISDEVTLEEFQSAWANAIERMKPEDTFLLVMLGHAQSDFVEPKFNLKGPDLGGNTLAAMMAAVPCEKKIAILSFPCSGHFSELLAPVEGLSIVASCDGPRQIFHSAMNPFLVQAFEDDWSDQDGDGELTVYELFQFLSDEVDDFYEGQEFVQISNVSLEDNGDGRVTTFAEDMDAGDGDRAKAYRIAPAPSFVEPPEEEEEAE